MRKPVALADLQLPEEAVDFLRVPRTAEGNFLPVVVLKNHHAGILALKRDTDLLHRPDFLRSLKGGNLRVLLHGKDGRCCENADGCGEMSEEFHHGEFRRAQGCGCQEVVRELETVRFFSGSAVITP